MSYNLKIYQLQMMSITYRKLFFITFFVLVVVIGSSGVFAETITGLVHTSPAAGTPVIVPEGLQNGALCNVDRSYRWHNVPSVLTGADYIMTVQDDADYRNPGNVNYAITISQAAILYIFITPDLNPPLPWMVDGDGPVFTKTDLFITMDTDFEIWSTDVVAAGTYNFEEITGDFAFYGIAAIRVSVGTQKQLFVDDYIVADMQNVVRKLGQVAKYGEPVMVPDRPWEDDYSFGYYGTVLYDANKFKMWYRASGTLLAYAESADGLNWDKPNLGIMEFGGSTQNNLIDPIMGYSGFTCFIDPHETDPQYKYKAAWGHPELIRTCLSYSADGLNWTAYNNGNPVVERAADTYNQLLWDAAAQTYRLYTRTDFGSGGGVTEIRGNRCETNPDVNADPTNWTRLDNSWYFNSEPNEPSRRQVYGLTSTIYEGLHLALMQVYEWPGDMSEGPYDTYVRHDRDIINTYLATSRDGENWDLSWVYAEQPIVPRGPDGSFDKDLLFTMSNIVTREDKHWIYYTGTVERHDIYPYPRLPKIGLATLRLDGFVSVDANDANGVLTTKPMTMSGERLIINTDAGSGSIEVEILDMYGNILDGFSRDDADVFTGDSIRHRVTWNDSADVSSLKDQAITVRFYLNNCKLYSFVFTKTCDFTGDGRVDFKDLAELAGYWLENEPSIDIAPAGGDGIINFEDFARLAEDWDG